jgi:hypothetical protein
MTVERRQSQTANQTSLAVPMKTKVTNKTLNGAHGHVEWSLNGCCPTFEVSCPLQLAAMGSSTEGLAK